MVSDYSFELAAAKQLALKAGKTIMDVYRTAFAITKKSDESPVTEADVRANILIVEGLAREFNRHGILSEESEDDLSRLTKRHVWICDPLDGTKEFIARNGEFTVNIALTCDGVPVVGVIYAPATNVLYYATSGGGAFVERTGSVQRMFVSKRSNFSDCTAVMSRSRPSEILSAWYRARGVSNIVARGSSLKGCAVAEGSADVYIKETSICQWDVCAMDAIVTEAGGKMTDFNGQSLQYNLRDVRVPPFVVSNATVHPVILSKLKEAL
jgi:3'(2'), 5'-bisphosphate nucleotidase